MKRLLFAFMFVCAFAFRAEAGSVMGAFGANVNFQLSTSGRSYEVAAPLAVRAGYRFSVLDVIGEYSYVRSSSGTDMVSIAQSNHEFLLWARKRFRLTPRLRPFIALGAGAHLQIVSTRFGSANEEEKGLDAEAAAAGGVEFKITRALAISAEGRATLGEGYSPNPMLSLASYISFLF
jgi:opacity protein-like surface antigen